MIDERPAMKPGVGRPVLERTGCFLKKELRKLNIEKN